MSHYDRIVILTGVGISAESGIAREDLGRARAVEDAALRLRHSLRDEPRNRRPCHEHDQEPQGLQRHHEGQIGLA
jgi:hypothetical protein